MRNWVSVMLLLLSACEGVIGSPSASGPDRDDDPIIDPAADCESREITLGATPIRRLTREQYTNSIQDVFGLDSLPGTVTDRLAQIPDGKRGSFANTTTAPSVVELNLYLDAATALTDAIGTAPVTELAGCTIETDGCAADAIAVTGRRFFRRTMTLDEHAAYLALYDEVRAAEGDEQAMAAVVTALLSSPMFLFREEPTVGDDAIRPLTDVALASRLSFFFWQSGLDAELLDVAEADELTADELEGQARRLLAHPNGRRGIHSFMSQWSGTHHLETQPPDHPRWSPELGVAMHEESERFVDHVMEQSGTLHELLTARYTFVDAQLAELYGVDAPAEDFGRVELPSERSGLLTHPSLLAAHGESPAEVRRGRFVREQLLCAPHFELPAEIVPDLEVDRMETNPCAGCHRPMDSIGFGFAQFDRLGALQAPPDGTPTPEVIADTPELEPLAGEFEDAAELAARLADSPVVEACVAKHWTEYASGRVGTNEDVCAVHALQRLFSESGGSIAELMVAIATSEWFRHRSGADVDAEEGEL